ncbi:MAG TPA: hypothetical protein PKV71_21885, partial [Calditrichia bacterium]|nr:hypothetical protein [Calditrichia bacterium]
MGELMIRGAKNFGIGKAVSRNTSTGEKKQKQQQQSKCNGFHHDTSPSNESLFSREPTLHKLPFFRECFNVKNYFLQEDGEQSLPYLTLPR